MCSDTIVAGEANSNDSKLILNIFKQCQGSNSQPHICETHNLLLIPLHNPLDLYDILADVPILYTHIYLRYMYLELILFK